MANRTVKDARSVRGTNPQYLIEKIIRTRIYDSKYWKEDCFALSAELLVDKAMSLRFVGGVYGGSVIATPFLCLILKMLQIQPEKDIIVEFIRNEEFKYVRALGAFYMRLTGTSIDCYKYLEPLLADSRKIRRMNRNAQYEVVHMDEFIDELLRAERAYDIILPRIQKRHVLEENNELEPKVSALDDDLEEIIESSDEEEKEKERIESEKPRDKEKEKDRDRNQRERDRRDRRDKEKRRDRSREKDRFRDRENRDKKDRKEKKEKKKDRDRVKDRDNRDRRERIERRGRDRHRL